MWLKECDFEFMIKKKNSNFFSFGTPTEQMALVVKKYKR